MEGLKRLVGAVSCALPCVVALAMAATSAAAGDRIARPPGAIDNRGYELVSQPDKNRANADLGALLSADGNRVLYSVLGGIPGSPTGSRPMLRAARTESGWESESLLPPRAQMLADTYFETVATPDLNVVVASVFQGLGIATTSPDESLVRLSAGGQTLLRTFPTYFGGSGISAVASDDVQRVLANVREPIAPSHVAGTSNVYDFGSGVPVLVSAMPGTNQASSCGVLAEDGGFVGFATGSYATATQHWVSVDGARAFFQTDGETCGGPQQLYMRDLVGGATTMISGPVVSGDPDNGVEIFVQATPDGSQAFYRTATSYDPVDDADGDNSDRDVYRWTVAGDNECITCGIPNANVHGKGFFDNVAVSEDGSHVYFTSDVQFGDAPSTGDLFNPNVYVWRHDTIDFVAKSNGIDVRPSDGGQLTPDGDVLVFMSFAPELDAASGRSNGGFFQYYRYDDRDGSITCLSCPANEPATSDVSFVLASIFQAVPQHVRALTDDGNIVFFPTSDALVPEDVNNGPDLYEWHNGQVGLITNGRTQYVASVAPAALGTSADGRDMLFIDYALLTPDAQDSMRKVYDARIDGGFPAPFGLARPCQGDQCRRELPGAPSLLVPGTASLTGSHTILRAQASYFVQPITPVQRVRLARTGVLMLSVDVRRGGKVSARVRAALGRRMHTVARRSRVADEAGTVKLRLHLSRAARLQLMRDGRMRLVVTVAFSAAATKRHFALSLIAVQGGFGRATMVNQIRKGR